MANAQVKSSQEIGSLALSVVNSKKRMRIVTQKQRHQVNIHHVQKACVECPTDATRLKEIQVKSTSSMRTMPMGIVHALKSSVTMVC